MLIATENAEPRVEHPVDVVERLAASNDWCFDREDEDEISIVVAGAWTVITKQFTPPGPWGTEGWPAMVAAVVALLAVVAGAVFPDSDQPTDDTGDASVHSKGIQS